MGEGAKEGGKEGFAVSVLVADGREGRRRRVKDKTRRSKST